MSWSEASAKSLRTLIVLIFVAVLAGCSGFHPVYSNGAASAGNHAFAYTDPGSRLDQIIYSELRLRLGPASTSPDAIHVTVSTWSGARDITRTNVSKPATGHEMAVSATITVVGADGKVLFSGVRSSSAIYNSVGQVLGDVEAQNEAAERAAKALADTVRLTVLGAIARIQ